MIQSLDNIGNTTSYNGLALLSGSFTNKEFQVGAFSNQSIKGSIGPTTSDKIGHVRVETGGVISGMGTVAVQFNNVPGNKNVVLESVVISTSAGTGVGALAEVINKNSEVLGGVKASFVVETTGGAAVSAATAICGLTINGVNIGALTDIQDNDRDGKLINAINARKEETGVQASIDFNGRLHLTALDGRGIQILVDQVGSANNVATSQAKIRNLFGLRNMSAGGGVHANGLRGYHGGRLTLTKLDASDIRITGTNVTALQFSSAAQTSVNLRGTLNAWNANQVCAMGANANSSAASYNAAGMSAGVTTTSVAIHDVIAF